MNEGYSWASITVTLPENGTDIIQANESFNARLTPLFKKLRRAYRTPFIGVVDWQKRGAVHLHTLILFPPDSGLSVKQITKIAKGFISGFGTQKYLEIKTSAQTTREKIKSISGYFAKNYVELPPSLDSLDYGVREALYGIDPKHRRAVGFKGNRLRKGDWRGTLTAEIEKRKRYSRKKKFLDLLMRMRNIRSSQIEILKVLLQSPFPLVVVSSGWLLDESYFKSQDFGLSARSPPRKGRWSTGEVKKPLKSGASGCQLVV